LDAAAAFDQDGHVGLPIAIEVTGEQVGRPRRRPDADFGRDFGCDGRNSPSRARAVQFLADRNWHRNQGLRGKEQRENNHVKFFKEPMVFGPLRRVKFLITAPFIVLMLFVINVMTSPGQWWVQWAAFGIGIAWVINFFKLIRDIILLGGLAAFGAYIFNRNRQS